MKEGSRRNRSVTGKRTRIKRPAPVKGGRKRAKSWTAKKSPNYAATHPGDVAGLFPGVAAPDGGYTSAEINLAAAVLVAADERMAEYFRALQRQINLLKEQQ